MRGLAAIAGWTMVSVGALMLSVPAGLITSGGLLLGAVVVLPVLAPCRRRP